MPLPERQGRAHERWSSRRLVPWADAIRRPPVKTGPLIRRGYGASAHRREEQSSGRIKKHDGQRPAQHGEVETRWTRLRIVAQPVISPSHAPSDLTRDPVTIAVQVSVVAGLSASHVQTPRRAGLGAVGERPLAAVTGAQPGRPLPRPLGAAVVTMAPAVLAIIVTTVGSRSAWVSGHRGHRYRQRQQGSRQRNSRTAGRASRDRHHRHVCPFQ